MKNNKILVSIIIVVLIALTSIIVLLFSNKSSFEEFSNTNTYDGEIHKITDGDKRYIFIDYDDSYTNIDMSVISEDLRSDMVMSIVQEHHIYLAINSYNNIIGEVQTIELTEEPIRHEYTGYNSVRFIVNDTFVHFLYDEEFMGIAIDDCDVIYEIGES